MGHCSYQQFISLYLHNLIWDFMKKHKTCKKLAKIDRCLWRVFAACTASLCDLFKEPDSKEPCLETRLFQISQRLLGLNETFISCGKKWFCKEDVILSMMTQEITFESCGKKVPFLMTHTPTLSFFFIFSISDSQKNIFYKSTQKL